MSRERHCADDFLEQKVRKYEEIQTVNVKYPIPNRKWQVGEEEWKH